MESLEARNYTVCQQIGCVKLNSLVLSYKEKDIITEGEALSDLHDNFV